MLKRYLTWLKEVLPESVWESLEEELSFMEETLPFWSKHRTRWEVHFQIFLWSMSLFARVSTRLFFRHLTYSVLVLTIINILDARLLPKKCPERIGLNNSMAIENVDKKLVFGNFTPHDCHQDMVLDLEHNRFYGRT